MKIDPSKIEYDVFPLSVDESKRRITAISHLDACFGFAADSDPIDVDADAETIIKAADQARDRLFWFLEREYRHLQDAASVAIGRLSSFERELLDSPG